MSASTSPQDTGLAAPSGTDDGDSRRKRREEALKQTYYGLRYGMIVLACMLYVAVLFQQIAFDCYQGSISAYYFTPVRPVLIAALSGIGVGLIVYRGNSAAENWLLDVAGFLAIVVAFVPTGAPDGTGCNTSDNLLDAATAGGLGIEQAVVDEIERAYDQRVFDDIMDAIANSAFALLVAAFLATLLGLVIAVLSRGDSPKPIFDWRRALAGGLSILALLSIGAYFYRNLEPETFRYFAHPVAAITFFSFILIVLLVNAISSKAYRWYYVTTLLLTIVLMIGIVLHRHAVPAWVFWLETSGVAGFVVFWWIQTAELGGAVNRESVQEL